jgi:O-antigen/teichoic acid export membrane protein
MFNLKISKMMKDIQWSFVGLATASLTHLLLRVLLGRELGPSGLGLYTLVFTIYMFGTQFATLGMNSAMTKYIAEYNENLSKIKEYVSSGILGSIVSGSLMGILLYLFSSIISTDIFHLPEMSNLLKFTALCFPFISMQKTIIGTLNGLREMKWYAILNIAQNLLMVIVSFFMVIVLNMEVMGAVLGFVIPTIVVGLFSLIFARNLFVTPTKLTVTVLKEISWFGFYVVLANSIGMINTQIDSLMIGYFMEEIDVGYYAVAIMLVQGVILLPQAVQAVTTPSIATYYGKGDFNNIQQLIKNTMLRMSAAIGCIALILAIFGKFLISLVFTDEFLPAYLPMLILLIGYSIYAAYASIGGCLASVGKVQMLFRIDAICAGLNTLLNIVLVPRFGLLGAASATSIALIFTALTNLYYIRKYSTGKANQTNNNSNGFKSNIV